MKITSGDYVRLMIPFLKGLPAAMRSHDTCEKLKYYGTGEAAHWSVQCNQQMFGALACLADEPDLAQYHPVMQADELRETALSMFRYSMRTHLTGDLQCSDGKQWGKHWISVLGMERAVPGINALEPYFTDEDRERYRNFRIFESDYRLNSYPVEACMDARKGHNVPESNIWNAGFLMRTALDYPDLPQAAGYLEKATAMMLNGISCPSDEFSEELFNGKKVSEWYVGPNFTENFSLDHHGYMNMGYSYICLSNIALLYFNFKERGQAFPPELLHNVRKLWNVVKHFVFPDGRLLRIGGDTRTRYNYCQCFAISAWILAAELFHDPDAVRYEKGFLALMEKEQSGNADGSFYGTRLKELKDYSYFFYRRLEADPMHALGTGAYWRRKFDIFDSADEKSSPEPLAWHDDFHGASMLRTEKTVRSVVERAENTQQVLCLPLDRSDMAEWHLNLTGYIGCHRTVEQGTAKLHDFPGGFTYARRTAIEENAPMGEGEERYTIGVRHYFCAAVPDGRTLLTADRVDITKETTLTFGFQSLHCNIPNDVYNDYKRVWTTADGRILETKNLHGTEDLLETDSNRLNCDNALSFFALDGGKFRIKRSAKQNVFLYNGLWGMYADIVCREAEIAPYRAGRGEVLYDIACAVAPSTAAEMQAHGTGTVESVGCLKVLTFTGFDGKQYTFVLNYASEPAEYHGFTVPADDCILLSENALC